MANFLFPDLRMNLLPLEAELLEFYHVRFDPRTGWWLEVSRKKSRYVRKLKIDTKTHHVFCGFDDVVERV